MPMRNPDIRFKVQGANNASLTPYNLPLTTSRGYTLIELIIAVGLFALVMTLVSGAYIVMIGLTERAQGAATGIDNLSFALETMTRSIRTGTNYDCSGPGDCPNGYSSFSFINASNKPVSYGLSGSSIRQTVNGITGTLTDPSVTISSLTFYVSGTNPPPSDYRQPSVTVVVSGTTSAGSGGKTQSFTVETGATMRTPDL